MAIPRNLANFANQLNTSGESPKIQVGDSKVEVTDTGSNGTIVFNTDGSERMKVTSAGNVEITGNLVVADGKGIDFSATPGTGTSELFDDYEEGTFTPAFAFSTSGSVTYGTQEGRYTKVGRLVTCNIALGLSAVSSPTGEVTITGLPFTSGSGESSVSSASIGIMRNFATAVSLRLYKSVSTTIMVTEKNATNAGYTSLAGSDLGSSTLLYFTVTYNV